MRLCGAIGFGVTMITGLTTAATADEAHLVEAYRCTATKLVCRQAPCASFVCVKPGHAPCRAAYYKHRYIMYCRE